MCKWIKVKISDLGKVVGGATPSTNNDEYYNGDIIWITPKDLSNFNGRYILKGERNITRAGMESCSTQMLPKGSILFSSRAPIGYVAIAAREMCTNQGFKSVIPNETVDYLFLYYLLKYNRDKIESMGSGTTFKEVSGSTMKNIEVIVPESIGMQRTIADILDSIDSKIENNIKLNDNLEQQASALFKSYFVDFEPTYGVVPDSWQEYRLGDFLPVITGKKNANISSATGKYPFFSCSQDIAWTNEHSFDGSAILVAGNGDFNVKFYDGKFEAYQRTYVLIPNNARYTAWLYYAVKYNLNKITMAARGSVIKFITKGNLEDFTFYAPCNLNGEPIIDHFTVINKTIAANRSENFRLSELRDTLLPKLMSGKLDVSAVEL